MKKIIIFSIKTFMLLMLCMGAAVSNATTTYRLQRVTAVEAGGLYVFEQCGRVMKNTLSSNALQTTNVFKSTGLEGNESYVWTLVSSGSNYKIKSNSTSKYITNSSSTSISLPTSSTATSWKFSRQDNNKFIIENPSNNYCLAYEIGSSYQYKARPQTDKLYQHDITVYRLVDEATEGKPTPLFYFPQTFAITMLTGEFTPPALQHVAEFDGTVTYSSSNPNVATVDPSTGTVTMKSHGKTTITATSAATTTYEGGEASYLLVVMDGDGTEGKPYSVSDFKSEYVDLYSTTNLYFKGYIVGGYDELLSLANPAINDKDLALADSHNESNVANTLPVSISSTQESSYGLTSNPNLLGKMVKIMGKSGLYNGMNGIRTLASLTVTACPVTITSAKYATYSSTYAMDYSGTGITAYTAELSDGYVVLTPVEDGIIPANKGIILYSEDAGTTPVPVTAESGTVSETGLKISDGTTAVGANIYVLGKKNDKVGFYRWTSASSLSSGRVYLDSASSAHEYLSFVLNDGMTTGIDAVQGEGLKANGEYYNLNGQRVAQPTKGLYIMNGRKVIIK
jgi:hypothetical protein